MKHTVTHFRRRIAALTAAAAMCAALPVLPLYAAQTLAGDVDGSGAVEVTDIVLLQKYLVGLETLDQTALDNANVYADDAVDIFDLAKLKNMVLTPAAAPVTIHLADTGISAEGDNANAVQISGTDVKITASGVYYVDGSITDGQILIETAADDIEDVEIVLNGASFVNTTKQAILTSASSGNDKTKITLLGENTMTDGSASAYTTGGAVIYANNKLTFTRNSTGTLTISSLLNDGIHAEKKLNLNGGTISIDTDTVPEGSNAVPDADGITSDKSIEIEGAVLDLDTSADGIKSDAGIYVYDGDVQIKSGNDAMQSVTEIAVSGGNLTASGDRGFRLTGDTSTGLVGKLSITGGKVMATATDYQADGNETIDLTGTIQTVMLFDMAAQWKKASAIGVGALEFTANKKYNYVLVSDPSLAADGSYTVTVGGAAAVYGDAAAGTFQNTGVVNRYTAVAVQ